MSQERALNLPLYRHRWFQITTITLLVLIILLTALPYAISYSTQRWILANGGEHVQVRDVDFNPFTGTLIFEEMQVRVDETSALEVGRVGVQFAWSPLFQRRTHIRTISLDDFDITIDHHGSGAMRIGGIILPESQEEADQEISWLIGIDQVTLANCKIHYSNPELKISATIDSLTIGDLAQWTPDKGAELHLEGSLNGSALKVDGFAAPFAEEPHFSGQINLSELQIEGFASLAKPPLTVLEGILTINSQMKVHKDKEHSLTITQEGLVSIAGSKIITASVKGSFENFTWKGLSSTTVTYGNGTFLSQTEGKLAFNGIEVSLPDRDLFVRSGSALWNGTITLDGRGDMTGITLAGGGGLQDLEANAEERKINLLSLASLDANSMSAEAVDNLAISEIVVKGLILAKGNESGENEQADGSLSRAGEMIISNIGFHRDTGLSIESITEKDLQTVISRDRDGQWNAVRIIDILARLVETKTEPGGTGKDGQGRQDSERPRESKDRTGFRIGKVQVIGDSALSFIDLTAKPQFSTTLHIVSAQIRDIDNARADKPSPISFAGLVGKHAKAQISGIIRPFAIPIAYELKGNVEGYELPSLSSYTIKELGFEVSSGQLDADFMVMADKGLLDGKTDMTIHQFSLGKEDKSRLGALEKDLAVPLNVALKMLEDKNKTIHLEVPFQGEPNNPDFDFSDAINQALASAMKKGAMTYLTLALQPYGSLITLAKFAGDAATKVKLNPVVFSPGSSELGAESFGYLEKIATILRERPGLSIRICGVAVKSDLTALVSEMTGEVKEKELPGINNAETGKNEPLSLSEEQLNALAKERADATKDYLVIELGAEVNKLVACKPYLDMDKEDAHPRVDLLI